MRKKKNNFTPKKMFSWSLTFTKKVILLTTIIFFTMTIYDATMITIAIFKISNFSYLDTFISELNETFRIVVGINICGKVIENVFRYNSFSGESTYPDDINNEEEPIDEEEVEEEEIEEEV